MKEITVKYLISDEEEDRLKKLLPTFQSYKNDNGEYPFRDWTIDNVFDAVMTQGSKYDINKKLAFIEWKQGLIDYDEMIRREKE